MPKWNPTLGGSQDLGAVEVESSPRLEARPSSLTAFFWGLWRLFCLYKPRAHGGPLLREGWYQKWDEPTIGPGCLLCFSRRMASSHEKVFGALALCP